jgi:hypothetical protein
MKLPPDAKYKTRHVPLDFEYEGSHYKGEAVPVTTTCSEEVCWELEITLNNEELGKIHCTKTGWRMDYVKQQGLVNAIGKIIALWYE